MKKFTDIVLVSSHPLNKKIKNKNGSNKQQDKKRFQISRQLEAPVGMMGPHHVTNEDSLDDMPNTVGPNPNIFGGFPENDVWGNFELPNPDTIDRLKLALKLNHHRPMYAGEFLI